MRTGDWEARIDHHGPRVGHQLARSHHRAESHGHRLDMEVELIDGADSDAEQASLNSVHLADADSIELSAAWHSDVDAHMDRRIVGLSDRPVSQPGQRSHLDPDVL